jgi:integrase
MAARDNSCAGTTNDGSPCRNPAKNGSDRCPWHTEGYRRRSSRKSKATFGNVRRRSSGRWQARYRHEGAWYTAPNTFEAKADANAWLSTVQTDLLRGSWVNPTAGKQTFGDYARCWLDGRSDLRPSTRGKYEELLRRHLIPKFGAREIARLAPSDVRAWYHVLAAQHRTTADDAYRALRAILNTAVADELLVKSPCTVKGAGSVRAAERPVASIKEVARAVEAVPEEYRVGLLLAAWCQLRRGELLGLQRRHVDFVNGTIRIEQTWVVTPEGIPVLGPPKTEAGVRKLNVPAHILPILGEHLERFTGQRPEAWLLSGPNGEPVSGRTIGRYWDKARRSIGRPDLHLHDLRHSGLTWSAATGASVADLMRRGGHASPAAALRYQHATEDRDKALADALAALSESASLGSGSSKER